MELVSFYACVVVCSVGNFVSISVGSGGVRRSFHPRLGCRTALILLVLVCRAVFIFVEQPASSRLFMVPYYEFIQDMCKRFGIRLFNSFLWGSQFYVRKQICRFFLGALQPHCCWVGWRHLGIQVLSPRGDGGLRRCLIPWESIVLRVCRAYPL